MKIIIYILGLLSFLMASTSAKAVVAERTESPPEAWVMSIEICKDLPTQIQDEMDRGIVFMPWIQQQSQSCKWFGVGINDIFGIHQENELAVWKTYQECMDSPINVPEGFTLKTKYCQSIIEYNPDKPRRRN